MRQTTKKIAASNTRTRGRKQPVRLKIEGMEDRTVPAALSLMPQSAAILSQGNDVATYNNSLVFGAASPGSSTDSLWSTDGTAANTGPIGGAALAKYAPSEVISANGMVVFSAKDSTAASDTLNLYGWTANDAGAAVKLTNFAEGRGATNLKQAGNTVYFFHATQASTAEAMELWASDGTAAGTRMVKSFAAGVAPFAFEADTAGASLYFRVKVDTPTGGGMQLWTSDGTAGGTRIAGTGTESPTVKPSENLVGSGDKLFFTVANGTGMQNFWVASGGQVTALDAKNVGNLTEGAGGIVVFTATGDHGTVIAMSNGTARGTFPIADSGRFPKTLDKSTIDNLTVARSIVYFTANEASTGNELWMAQGNIVSLVSDVAAGTASSNPMPMASVGETLYFAAADAAHGRELFATDGTTSGTGLVVDVRPGPMNSDPSGVSIVNGRVVYSATSPKSERGDILEQMFYLDGDAANPPREEAAPSSYDVAVSTNAGTVAFGSGITLNVQVTPQDGSPAPTGRIHIYDAGVHVGSADVAPNGSAVWTSSPMIGTGDHSFSVKYENDSGSFNSPMVSVGVGQNGTTTALSSSASSVGEGQGVTFTAKVASTGITAMGTVTFREGTTVLGTASLKDGIASLTVTTFAAGSHSVVATYDGSPVVTASSSQAVGVTVTANRAATTTALVSSAATAAYGQRITFTATVASASGTAKPTGTVTFTDGTTTLGTAQVGTNGKATFTANALTVGTHSVTATYGGSATMATSTSGAVSVAVKSATAVAVTTPASTVIAGKPVVLTARVNATAGGAMAPAGTVTFKDGTTVIGTATLTGGVATLTVSNLARGVHGVTASYDGNAMFSASKSAATYVTVRGADATAKLTAESRAGQVTLTATLTPRDAAAGQPTGKVAFYDGAAVLGTVDVVNGKAVWTGTTGYGSRTFRAVFTADGAFNNATAPNVNYAVRYPVSITLNAPLPTAGAMSTFTATVTPLTPGAPKASGRMAFLEGSTVLAVVPVVNGVAQLQVGNNGKAYHSYEAIYYGGDTFESGAPNVVVYGTPTGTSADRLAPMPPIAQVKATPAVNK